jgi:sugar/nucleoside kinase (ribokinase family)
MNDDTLAEASIAATAWRELTAQPTHDLIGQLAEAARRHRVFVSITVSPHDSDLDDE